MARKRQFTRQLQLDVPVERLREFHYSATAILLLTPKFLKATISGDLAVRDGNLQIITTSVGPFRSEWHARISDVSPAGFTDTAEKSPFSYFRHRHAFDAEGDGCVLTDSIEFSPGIFWPGLALLFWYRHRVTRRLLTRDSG